jgi:hypothetical protein
MVGPPHTAEAVAPHQSAEATPPRRGTDACTRFALALGNFAPDSENLAEIPEGPPSWTPESFGSLFGDADEAETTTNLGRSRILRRRGPRRNLAALQEEELSQVLTELPGPGESFHLVSNGRWDYWRLVPVVLDLLGRPAEALYGSTWTMSRQNVRELLDLFDAGRIKAVSVTSGTYFLRRESAVAATLQEGLRARGQRYKAFANHAKVVLLAAPPDFLVFEGSANWTANPRLEQNVLINDRELYDFHRAWMEHVLPQRTL